MPYYYRMRNTESRIEKDNVVTVQSATKSTGERIEVPHVYVLPCICEKIDARQSGYLNSICGAHYA